MVYVNACAVKATMQKTIKLKTTLPMCLTVKAIKCLGSKLIFFFFFLRCNWEAANECIISPVNFFCVQIFSWSSLQYILYSVELLTVCTSGHNLYSKKPDALNIFYDSCNCALLASCRGILPFYNALVCLKCASLTK